MEAIKHTIINVMQDLAAKKTGRGEEEPESRLKKVLTKKELAHIKVNYFRKGILGVSVDSSSWLYNLTLQKEILLEKLNHLDKKPGAIKAIRFRIGETR